MVDESNTTVIHTLEHAFDSGNGDGTFVPKVAAGIYICERSLHRLHNMTSDFETFQLIDVPPFQGKPITGILLHWGNYDKDSDGCLLLGRQVTFGPGGLHMITDSKDTFAKFMALQSTVNSFYLTIK